MEQKITSTLQGKKVVVLGGSSGIGLEVSRAALAQGAEVVIASSNQQRIDQAIAELGGNATGSALNLTDEAAIEAWFKQLGSQLVDPGNPVFERTPVGTCGTPLPLDGYTLVTASDLA